MPRPSIDFAVDAAAAADGERLLNVIASGMPEAQFAVYVSGDDLGPDVAGSVDGSVKQSYGRHISMWDDVRLLACANETLGFVNQGGQRVYVPLVSPLAPAERLGASELIVTLL